MFDVKEKTDIEIFGTVGFKEPFSQGGSYALTIPKRVVKKFRLDEKGIRTYKTGESF